MIPKTSGFPTEPGVLPLITSPGTPQPSDDLSDGVAVPEHVSAWKRSVPVDVGVHTADRLRTPSLAQKRPVIVPSAARC